MFLSVLEGGRRKTCLQVLALFLIPTIMENTAFLQLITDACDEICFISTDKVLSLLNTITIPL